MSSSTSSSSVGAAALCNICPEGILQRNRLPRYARKRDRRSTFFECARFPALSVPELAPAADTVPALADSRRVRQAFSKPPQAAGHKPRNISWFTARNAKITKRDGYEGTTTHPRAWTASAVSHSLSLRSMCSLWLTSGFRIIASRGKKGSGVQVAVHQPLACPEPWCLRPGVPYVRRGSG
jgi:hypothetical protein